MGKIELKPHFNKFINRVPHYDKNYRKGLSCSYMPLLQLGMEHEQIRIKSFDNPAEFGYQMGLSSSYMPLLLLGMEHEQIHIKSFDNPVEFGYFMIVSVNLSYG